jgi:hypothetical protein
VTRIPRRAAGVAAAAAMAASALSGCAAGLGANTTNPYAASNGSVATVGTMNVQDVVVIDDGNVPELSTVLINNGPTSDVLTSVDISSASKPTLPVGGLGLLPGQAVTIGPTGTTRIVIDGLTAKLGQVVKVTFAFRDAGTATVSALILAPSDLTAGG